MRAPSTRVPHDASAMRVPHTETSKRAAVQVGFGSGVSPRCPAAPRGSCDKAQNVLCIYRSSASDAQLQIDAQRTQE
jgi:hypothetical protein